MSKEMIKRKSWEKFRESGLLWFVNRSLHLFGWAIVVEVDFRNRITGAYPARTKFRGFSTKLEEDGFKKLTKHMKDNVKNLLNVVAK